MSGFNIRYKGDIACCQRNHSRLPTVTERLRFSEFPDRMYEVVAVQMVGSCEDREFDVTLKEVMP